MKADAATVVLPAHEIARLVEDAALRLKPLIDDDAVVVCLLTGGLWFAADLTRALSRLGVNPQFDALWLASYGDDTESRGRIEVRAGLQRSVEGRTVVLVDEVMDSGLSLSEAARIVRKASAARVLGCVFARKPWPEPRDFAPEVVAWEAPARFLAGYGMDLAGCWRGVPDVVALD
ncbi:MAG TPA: phosphoribosyltransferase family protein [Caulobacteraceae bacterium]|jgi:hypoxanthine phosphoribosyltransferase|nr:phosphoribosyltransferase family protein [Caulobacteraceae bacterium]